MLPNRIITSLSIEILPFKTKCIFVSSISSTSQTMLWPPSLPEMDSRLFFDFEAVKLARSEKAGEEQINCR